MKTKQEYRTEHEVAVGKALDILMAAGLDRIIISGYRSESLGADAVTGLIAPSLTDIATLTSGTLDILLLTVRARRCDCDGCATLIRTLTQCIKAFTAIDADEERRRGAVH